MDERARHRLYRRLEEVLGPEDAGTLMNHLPPAGFADLATRDDLQGAVDSLRAELSGRIEGLETRMETRMESLEHRLTAQIERSGRRLVMWTSSMVLASAAVAFAAGRVG